MGYVAVNTLTGDVQAAPTAQNVVVTDEVLRVELLDARSLEAPLAWHPRLQHARPEERSHWRLIGRGEGIHWPDLDEDISVENVLLGKPSGESPHSLHRWLEGRSVHANRSS